MPSAASVKVDKQINSSESSALVESGSTQQNNNTPIRQALVIIEHKIRNLEKRKAKLESYRELQNSGKELNNDQRVAVAKFEEVVQTLEFARDLCKQFNGIALLAEKDAKKLARKEASARSQQELSKIREVLLVQDALQQLGNDTVREDFLLGRNGAASLSEDDLKLMDDLYTEVVPKHEPGSPAEFTTQVQTAAEHLLAVVDGKPKEVFGSTYSHIKEVIGKIHESGYLDQLVTENNVTEFTEEDQENTQITETLITSEPIVGANVTNDIPPMEGMPLYLNVPPETIPQEEVTILPPPQPVIPEQQYFQQPRPISEVLGTAPFLFLQESELDSPEQTPQNPVMSTGSIPSQTFTNQKFVGVPEPVQRQTPIAGFPSPNPPPPIPMPPSHITGLDFVMQANPMQTNPMAYTNYQQSPVQDESHQQLENTRNGGDGDGRDNIKSSEDSGSPRGGQRNNNRNNQKRNGPPNSGQGYHPTYYQNNNMYNNSNNRQRSNRGGQRQGGGNRPMQHSQNKMKTAQH